MQLAYVVSFMYMSEEDKGLVNNQTEETGKAR